MRILLISDTHGDVEIVNEVAVKAGVEACFHLGDFCCYTEESVLRFSRDMLEKQLVHSRRVPLGLEMDVGRMSVEALRELVYRYRTYGDFGEYMAGRKSFVVPVFAVGGNNDDPMVMQELGRHPIPNLTFLDAEHQVELGEYLVYGVEEGSSSWAGEASCEDGGVVGTSCLVRRVRELGEKKRIQLSHIPPYESAVPMDAMQALHPVLALCGHSHHWDEREIKMKCGGGTIRVLTLPLVTKGYAILELEASGPVYATHRFAK